MISCTFVRHLEAGSIPDRDSQDYVFFRELMHAKGYMANPGRYNTLTSAPTWLTQPQWDLYILSLFKLCQIEDTPATYLQNFQRLIHAGANHINYGTKDGWALVQSIRRNYEDIIQPKPTADKTYLPAFDASKQMVNNDSIPVKTAPKVIHTPKGN